MVWIESDTVHHQTLSQYSDRREDWSMECDKTLPVAGSVRVSYIVIRYRESLVSRVAYADGRRAWYVSRDFRPLPRVGRENFLSPMRVNAG
jgi:hypothetical protein